MMQVSCPICKKIVVWSEANPARPFCSDRCRTQDLSAWATEQYGVEVPIDESDFDERFSEE